MKSQYRYINTVMFLAVFMVWTVGGAGLLQAQPARTTATAVFAGGCFWCMEPPYDALEGVLETTSGFAGGHVVNPTYNQVVSGGTGHLEVVQVTYDPSVVDYARLLEVFWVNIDPLDGEGQFCDRGEHYTSAIFYGNENERRLAEASRQELIRSGRFGSQEIQTGIRPLTTFYPAEEYHQNYYQKNPIRYRFYRNACGRDRRLRELWGS
ncbi:MAG: peptide-methionine (S)-S-oxide reductase [Spirochaetaceae bacterium]|nr:MAG: peptide-methionine (S)-S-oxide reductase [Spirochaetaceae bacterium]